MTVTDQLNKYTFNIKGTPRTKFSDNASNKAREILFLENYL